MSTIKYEEDIGLAKKYGGAVHVVATEDEARIICESGAYRVLLEGWNADHAKRFAGVPSAYVYGEQRDAIKIAQGLHGAGIDVQFVPSGSDPLHERVGRAKRFHPGPIAPTSPTTPTKLRGPETGPNFAQASETINQTTPKPTASGAYPWDAEKHGGFMRTPNSLIDALRDEELTRRDVVLYAVLSRMEMGTFVCWPSHQELVDATGLTPGQVRTCIGHLVKHGYVAVEPWRTRHGDNDTSVFVLFPRCTDYKLAELSALRDGFPAGKEGTK